MQPRNCGMHEALAQQLRELSFLEDLDSEAASHAAAGS